MLHRGWPLLLLASAMLACSAARPLRPLDAGAFAVDVSVPGVWTQGSQTFPVGLPVVGVRYGLTGEIEAAARWYAPLAALKIVGGEAGAVWHAQPAHGWIPGLHVGAEVSMMTAPAHLEDGLGNGVRGAGAVDAIAHWEPLKWLWPYVAVQNAVVFADGRYVASAYAGGQVHVSDHWDFSVESGVAAVNLGSRELSEPYLGVAGRGALWMSWSVSYRFDAPARWRDAPSSSTVGAGR